MGSADHHDNTGFLDRSPVQQGSENPLRGEPQGQVEAFASSWMAVELPLRHIHDGSTFAIERFPQTSLRVEQSQPVVQDSQERHVRENHSQRVSRDTCGGCGAQVVKPRRGPMPHNCERCRSEHRMARQNRAYLRCAMRFAARVGREDVRTIIESALRALDEQPR